MTCLDGKDFPCGPSAKPESGPIPSRFLSTPYKQFVLIFCTKQLQDGVKVHHGIMVAFLFQSVYPSIFMRFWGNIQREFFTKLSITLEYLWTKTSGVINNDM